MRTDGCECGQKPSIILIITKTSQALVTCEVSGVSFDVENFAAVIRLQMILYVQQPLLVGYELVDRSIAFRLGHGRQIFYKGIQPEPHFAVLHGLEPFLLRTIAGGEHLT